MSAESRYDEAIKVLIVHELTKLLSSLSEVDRAEVMSELPFCKHCWTLDPDHKCQCWNDE